jgi:hypothetical protein
MAKLTPLAARWFGCPTADTIWTVDVRSPHVDPPVLRHITSCRNETIFVNHGTAHDRKARFALKEVEGEVIAEPEMTHLHHRAGQGYIHFQVYPFRTEDEAVCAVIRFEQEIAAKKEQDRLWKLLNQSCHALMDQSSYLALQLASRMPLEEAIAEVGKINMQLQTLLDRPKVNKT